MINPQDAVVCRVQPFKIKMNGEPVLGKSFLPLQEAQSNLLAKLLVKPYASCISTYRFTEDADLQPLMQQLAEGLDLEELSEPMAKWIAHNLPETYREGALLYISEVDNLMLNQQAERGITFHLYRTQEDFMATFFEENDLNISFHKGLSSKKPDLSFMVCLTEEMPTIFILNANFMGYELSIEDFLGVTLKKDFVNHTHHMLNMTKEFIVKQIPEEFEIEKTDQIDLLNRSVEYFKHNETFNQEQFAEDVFKEDSVIQSFQKFDRQYKQDNDFDVEAEFRISPEVVKKQSKVFKSVLKLDKNFHIYIHGNRELIEKGEDEEGRKYYKIFYENEF